MDTLFHSTKCLHLAIASMATNYADTAREIALGLTDVKLEDLTPPTMANAAEWASEWACDGSCVAHLADRYNGDSEPFWIVTCPACSVALNSGHYYSDDELHLAEGLVVDHNRRNHAVTA